MRPSYSSNISLINEGLLVRLSRSSTHRNFIRSLSGSRYEKSKRGWIVSLRHFEKLVSSSLFHPNRTKYELSIEDTRRKAAREVSRIHEALARVRENPFSVQPEDLSLVPVAVRVELSEKRVGLRIHVLKREKTVQKILDKFPGSHYVRGEGSYFLCPTQLKSFLSVLSEKGVLFAVTTKTCEFLQRTREQREGIDRYGGGQNADTLLECGLTVVVVKKEKSFELREATPEQLKDLLPSASSFWERQRAARELSHKALLGILWLAKVHRHRVWLESSVQESLEELRPRIEKKLSDPATPFELYFLGVVTPYAAWVTLPLSPEKPGILLDLKHPKGQGVKERLPAQFFLSEIIIGEGLRFYELSTSKLGEGVEALQQAVEERLPRSLSFLNAYERWKEHQHQIKQQLWYASKRDLDPLLKDATLQAKLFPHQRVAVHWLNSRHAGLLGDDMGLGKTLSILATFSELHHTKKSDFLLIICPNSLLKNWIREASEWVPHLSLKLLPKGKSSREKFLSSGELFEGDGLVVNYETARIPSVTARLTELCQKRQVFLCLDESQRVKNSTSKSFQALREIASHSQRRFLLSGTPIPKDISDIWSQMFLIDGGKRLGTNYYDWLKTVAELGNKYSDVAVQRFIPERVEEVTQVAREVILRRRKEEVLHLPEKIFSRRDTPLTGSQKKRYDEIRKELLLRVSSINGKTYIREIDNILEEYLRAVQISSNPRLIDEKWQGDPVKFVELDSLIDEIVVQKGEKIVVWTNFRGNVFELSERYQPLGVGTLLGGLSAEKREETVRAFQADTKLKILIAIPAAGGVGLTLTAAQTAVYLDKTWNAEHWLQSVDRIHRIGQKGTAHIITLHGSKMDEMITRNLRRKERDMRKLFGEEAGEGGMSLHFPSREELLEALSE